MVFSSYLSPINRYGLFKSIVSVFLACSLFCYGGAGSVRAQEADTLNTSETFLEETPYDGRDFSFGQKFTQSFSSALASVSLVFPVYAMLLDVQAHQPIRFTPAHLYRGFGVLAARSLPTTSAVLMTNELLGGSNPDASMSQQLGAALGAGGVYALISNPFELIATQQRFLKKTPQKVKSQIIDTKGYRGLGYGMKATLMRDAIFGLGLFTLPGVLQGMLPESLQENSIANLGAVATSGVIAGILSLPFDAIRGKMHRETFEKGKPLMNFSEAVTALKKQGGTKEFFKGYQYRASILALSFTIISSVRGWMKDWHAEQNIQDHLESNPPAQTPSSAPRHRYQPLFTEKDFRVQRPSTILVANPAAGSSPAPLFVSLNTKTSG